MASGDIAQATHEDDVALLLISAPALHRVRAPHGVVTGKGSRYTYFPRLL